MIVAACQEPLAVNITSDSIRFYVSNGWNQELLIPYLVKGQLYVRGDGLQQYYALCNKSQLNVEKMIEDGVIGFVEGKKYYTDTKDLDDHAVLHLRNNEL